MISGGERISKIGLAVLTQYGCVTDRQTDRRIAIPISGVQSECGIGDKMCGLCGDREAVN